MFKLKRSKADKLFSDFIRMRANWTCERCFTKYEPPTAALHCSHFHGRGKKSVRFDPDNAAAMCYGCHRHLTAHPLEHMDLFRHRLGETRFNQLTLRANTPTKVDEKMIEIILLSEIASLKQKQFEFPRP